MISSMLRVMVLGLIRDRGALVLAFVLPLAIFVIFAAIFSAAATDKFPLTVALGKTASGEVWDRLERVLRDEPSLRVLSATVSSQAQIARQVEQGMADAGLFIRGDPDRDGAAPLIVLAEPSRPLAGAVLAGQIQGLVARQMPDLALSRMILAVEPIIGGLTPEQTARIAEATQELAVSPERAASRGSPGLVQTILVGPANGDKAAVTYYAGAVAVLFLMFSSIQSAAVLIDERNSGILDRIAVVPGGSRTVVLGKFLFLVAQGIVQASLIFAAAAMIDGVNVISHLGSWLLVTLAAAMAASGLALAVAATCTTKQQAQTISTFVVLICSAVGGSMVPRFMMPVWLQDLGDFTPMPGSSKPIRMFCGGARPCPNCCRNWAA